MARSKRTRGKRKMNPTLFVFCEGETEESYVAFLRSKYRVPIQIKTKIAGNRITQRLVKSYMKGETQTPKDKIFLLYDLDVQGVLERLKKIDKAELLISNPCIELWFLLHYQNQTATLDSGHCLRILKNHIPNYRKGAQKDSVMSGLCEKADAAIERANELSSPDNPSTTVQSFVQLLKDLKRNK
ncbi:RloB family protein [Phaeodactylibacter xiamenensis]|uniref:RloB family protein n=1 Tax=Phaeodactylibacter xiamenensis TaxID=1524460 RepID=UPI0024A8792B|nr:RloB family protein [Phaeodactylibacter xiamenensis]